MGTEIERTPRALTRLGNLLDEIGVQVKIGLEAQGHIPTIEGMLAEGRTWEEIGRRIGWDGETARTWYADHLEDRRAGGQGMDGTHEGGKA